ncbi:helix-turn-helix domain-containing protein [Ureibacillus chungkukjangi]
MSRTNISNYESGRVSPPSTVIFALAELFSVSADFPY